jgi:hypothetical protein
VDRCRLGGWDGGVSPPLRGRIKTRNLRRTEVAQLLPPRDYCFTAFTIFSTSSVGVVTGDLQTAKS